MQVNELEQKNKELTSKIQHLEEVLEKFNEKETELLTEGLLNIPPNVDNSDPLTPLDKRYVTIEQLSEHYRLFVNRVQQQLATFGGGGEVFLARMEDVDVGSGIQTNGYVLKWDTSVDLFVPGEADSSISGINTTGTSYFNDVEVSGDLDVSGDLVYDEATARNWNVTGIATAAQLAVSGVATAGIITAYESISIGSTNLFTAIEGRTTIGLALALG